MDMLDVVVSVPFRGSRSEINLRIQQSLLYLVCFRPLSGFTF